MAKELFVCGVCILGLVILIPFILGIDNQEIKWLLVVIGMCILIVYFLIGFFRTK